MGKIFVAQGHATPKTIVGSGPKLNFSEILCLPLLPVKKIQSKIKVVEISTFSPFGKPYIAMETRAFIWSA